MFSELMEQLRGVGKDITQDMRTEQQRMLAELQQPMNQLRHGTETITLTVAKPYCAPARQIVTKTFDRYGVKLYGFQERVEKIEAAGFLRRMKVEIRNWENLKFGPGAILWLPGAWVAQVTVSAKAAVWAEYLLLRSGKLYVPGRYQDPRNQQWAEKHGGRMPPQWNESPWIETSCKEGMDAWQPLRDAMRDGQTPTNNRQASGRKRRK